MPYIPSKKQRKIFDKIIKDLALELQISGKLRGNLNYCIFRLFREYTKNFTHAETYCGMADFLSELHECECEIRRRFLQPYEDHKIVENGDVI